jgi:hypothetical protein
MAKRILIQTTIPPIEDDWHVGRFSMLADYLRSLKDEAGAPRFDVTARNRVPPGGPDPVLSTLDTSDYDQLWLFAVDVGDGLTAEDCAAIGRFRERGGGIMATRDHQDLGSSICTLGGVGKAHHFHSTNPEPDDRCCRDDQDTTDIDWPNYHSGSNGDFQTIRPKDLAHPLLRDPEGEGGSLQFLPAHPHEGAVSAPPGEPSAHVVATGVSAVTGNDFNLIVAFEAADGAGRAVAQSTFHHFCDYNLDPRAGCPSFVSEPPSDRMIVDPRGRRSAERYFRNLAEWLSP